MTSERYTAAVCELLQVAETQAAGLAHGAVTSEHLLLALVSAPLGTAGGVFAENGWGPDRLCQALVSVLADQTPARSAPGPLTLNSMQTLELAEAEADRRGHYYVDPDHLLLAVLSDATAATETLDRLRIMRSAICAAVEQRMWGVQD